MPSPDLRRSTGGPDERWQARARLVLLTVFSSELAVLVITGVALVLVYRPTARQSWSDLFSEGDAWGIHGEGGMPQRRALSFHNVTTMPKGLFTQRICGLRPERPAESRRRPPLRAQEAGSVPGQAEEKQAGALDGRRNHHCGREAR